MKVASRKARILIVDDTPGDAALLKEHLGRRYALRVVTDGPEALQVANAEQPDLILLDVVMPAMDGYTVCEKLKLNPLTRRIPVIFVTANSSPESLVRGIEAGAFYYLIKPFDSIMLGTIVRAALSRSIDASGLSREGSSLAQAMCFVQEGVFAVRTLEEAESLTRLLAALCPDPDRASSGFRELLINAIEHGSLGISYQEKARLLASGDWEGEVERRLALPENRAKRVTVRFRRLQGELHFRILDQGPGFRWDGFLSFDPGRAFDLNGRGILMSTMSFDRLDYQGRGNEVLAVVATEAWSRGNES